MIQQANKLWDIGGISLQADEVDQSCGDFRVR
jgi:hypothetical protein